MKVEEQPFEYAIGQRKIIILKSSANSKPEGILSTFSPVSSSFTDPVMTRKTPTPPMHPMRICRGKKPIRTPSRKAPRRKNVKPVKIEEKAKAASVVAMTSCGRSSPILSAKDVAIIWKNGC